MPSAWSLVVEALEEAIELRLLLQEVVGGAAGGFLRESEVHDAHLFFVWCPGDTIVGSTCRLQVIPQRRHFFWASVVVARRVRIRELHLQHLARAQRRKRGWKVAAGGAAVAAIRDVEGAVTPGDKRRWKCEPSQNGGQRYGAREAHPCPRPRPRRRTGRGGRGALEPADIARGVADDTVPTAHNPLGLRPVA